MTELEARMKVVNIMKAWVGGYEGGAIHNEILNTYNNHRPLAQGYVVKSWDAWCATTVSAAFIKAGMTSIAPTECSCPRMIQLYKNIGRWVENDAYVPQPGDIIMYDWQDSGSGDNVGTADHVGIVESCNGSAIVIIEGNMSNNVGRRNLQVNARYIRGYCCPNFAAYVSGKSSTSVQIDNTDYSALINQAVAAGDYVAAAKYEQKRNEKIDTMIAAGMTGYEKTYKYQSYLNASTVVFNVGDEVKLSYGAKYTNGMSVPNWVLDSKLYVRELRGDNIVFSTLKTGAITGVANKKYFSKAGALFVSYNVKVTADALNIRAGASTVYNINGVIRDHGIYTIVEEKNGFGKLENGQGWISLAYAQKV